MDVRLCTLLVLLSQYQFCHSMFVSGTITENVTFFYRKLPVAPSVRATIAFSVSYLNNSRRLRYPLMGIYTAYPKVNIEKRCSYIRYGQLRNEDLHPHLRLDRPYRTTACRLSGADTVNCRGRVIVQDYKPRSFYLTFGFYCTWPRINSLQGLTYKISFTMQSNGTSGSMKYESQLHSNEVCIGFYQQTSLPNLVGAERLNTVQNALYVFQNYQFTTSFSGRCHQHLLTILCHFMLPECDPVTQQLIHPCKEMCWSLLDACLQ